MPKKRTTPASATNPRRGRSILAEDGKTPIHIPGTAAAPIGFDAGEIADRLSIYWKSGTGNSYIIGSPTGRWSMWPEQAVIDLMREDIPERHIAIKARDGERTPEVKRVFLHIRKERCLDEVFTALPGYRSGIYDLPQGERVLVKSSPRLVEPRKGEFPITTALIKGRLDLSKRPKGTTLATDPEFAIDQTPWFYSWCKIADDAIRRGRPGHWRQGHGMILTGAAGSGKNRLQENLITPLLGHREADPTKMLFDGDEFNGDCFAAEHLLLSEVPTPSQRTVDRTLLGERIKRIVAQSLQRMRLMRTEPWTVFPFWRCTISVNDDPDKLRSLPIITPDIADKLLIFHCQHVPLPMPTRTIEEQAAFRQALADELPAFVWWLQNEWEIPQDLLTYPDGRDATRFGFREFHHPQIRSGLYEETPAAEFISLLDQARFTSKRTDFGEDAPTLTLWDIKSWTDEPGKWHGAAITLQQLLLGDLQFDCNIAKMAKKFFDHNSCARMLGRLAEDEKFRRHRVQRADKGGQRGWLITA